MKTLFKNAIYLMLPAMLSAVTASCDETTLDYEAGAPASDNCMNVYFSPDNETGFIFSDSDFDDGYSLGLKVSREKTDDAADVPVIVEFADECFKVASSVHFEAGEGDSQLTVEFPDIEKSKVQRLFLRIPDEYVSLYSRQEGVGRYVGTVLISQWRRIVKNAEVFGGNASGIDYEADIYWLAGANRFRFDNWMESGVNISFELRGTAFDPENTATWHGYLQPLDNYQQRSVDSDGYLRWYLYDDINGVRPTWYSSGGKLQNGNINFYADPYYNDMNIIDGNIDGYEECHGFIYKHNGGLDWIYFYYTADDINIEGWPEDGGEGDSEGDSEE